MMSHQPLARVVAQIPERLARVAVGWTLIWHVNHFSDQWRSQIYPDAPDFTDFEELGKSGPFPQKVSEIPAYSFSEISEIS